MQGVYTMGWRKARVKMRGGGRRLKTQLLAVPFLTNLSSTPNSFRQMKPAARFCAIWRPPREPTGFSSVYPGKMIPAESRQVSSGAAFAIRMKRVWSAKVWFVKPAMPLRGYAKIPILIHLVDWATRPFLPYLLPVGRRERPFPQPSILLAPESRRRCAARWPPTRAAALADQPASSCPIHVLVLVLPNVVG